MLAGKCPVCQQFVATATVHALKLQLGNGTYLNGVSYHCPNPMCNTIIGCQADPLALKSDTVSEVKAAIRQLLSSGV